jgi:outer membrane receptor protein involved in Fe transport
VSGLPGSAAVDYNTIPAQFIERVDVLTGGASAVYGSDAVAGVVNIIYKKNFEGVAFDGQYGESAESDNQETQFGITVRYEPPTMAAATSWRTSATPSRARCCRPIVRRSAIDQSRPAPPSRARRGHVRHHASVLFELRAAGALLHCEQPAAFPAPRSRTTPPRKRDSRGAPNGSPTAAATGFNRSAFRTIAVPLERYLFAGRGSFEYTEGHGAFFEGTYASSNSTSKLEPYPLGAEDIYPASGGQTPAEFNVGGVLVRNPVVPGRCVQQCR